MLCRVRTIVLLILTSLIGFTPCVGEVPTPLTVDEAVRTALALNPVVRAARERLIAADARIDRAQAERLPLVDAGLEYRRIASPPAFELPSPAPGVPPIRIDAIPRESTAAVITARQAIYTGGRVPALVNQAEALYDVELAQLGMLEADIALQTQVAYYSVLLAQSLVVSAQRSIEAAEAQLAVAQDMFEIGTAPQFDVLRAQTMVSEARQTLLEAQTRVEIARVALNRLMGVPLDSEFVLVEPVTVPPPVEQLPAIIEAAQVQRAELLAARARVVAAESGIRVVDAQRRPQVAVTVDYREETTETAIQPTGLTLLAVATIRVFDGGRTRAEVREAQALRDEAEAMLEETFREVEQDVREAYLDLETARLTLETAAARLAQAEEAYEIATVRYEAGVGTAVEIADALAGLTAARTNLDTAIYSLNIAQARLERAMGEEMVDG